jgi:lauroyl-KDO2-lipid IV(A) myristoyltransferase
MDEGTTTQESMMAAPEGTLRSPHPGPFRFDFFAPRYWGTWLGVAAMYLVAKLPSRARLVLGAWLGERLYLRYHKRRAIVETNLSWCFPERSEEERHEIARGFFRNMAQSYLDYGVLWWGRARQLSKRLSVEGEEHLRPHVEAGRPVILLTCHHTALDFAGIAINRRYKALSLFKHLRNPLMDWFVARGRARFGGIIFERSDNMLPLVRLVRQGYAFYYLPDEDLGPEKSVFAPFFGVPAATLPALGKLARMCRAVVVPYMAYHHEGHYVARLFPALKDFPTGNDVEDATQMNAALEEMIRLAPEQYIWSLRIFQTRPNGEAPPYAMKGRRSSSVQ